MSNLARPQIDWSKLARELGVFLGPRRQLVDVERKFIPENARLQVKEENNTNKFTSLWRLSGVKIGTNTDELGTLFARITKDNPAIGSGLVSLYRKAGGAGGDLVAQGSGPYGTTVVLATQNNLGLSGSVLLGVVTVSEADDNHQLLVYPDWSLRGLAVFDGSEPEHAFLQAAHLGAIARSRVAIQDAEDAWAIAAGAYLRTRWKSFMKSDQTSPITKATKNDQGLITTVNVGLLEDGRVDMVDELNAGPQKVVQNVVVSAAAVFDTIDQGKGTIAAPVMEEWAMDGTVTLRCFDATIGQEQFELSQFLTQTKETRIARNRLQVKRAFADPTLGIRSMLLTRIFTLEGGGLAADFGVITSWVLNGESPQNTNDGVIYLQVVKGVNDPTKWILNGYTSPSLQQSTQVFTTAESAAGATPALVAKNSSGITGSGVVGAAPTDQHTGNLNLNTFRTQNAARGVPDKATIAVTVSSRGQFQAQLADMFGYALNSTAAGGETLNEGYVSAGTFPPYSVLDA